MPLDHDFSLHCFFRIGWWLCIGLLLQACGGGSDGNKTSGVSPFLNCPAPQIWQNGICVTTESCSAENEKSWVRAHLDDAYLWYREIVDVPPSNFGNSSDYFYALLVRSRDRFSFVSDQAEVDAFQESGINTGYGVEWVNDSHDNAVRASYIEPDSPAARQGIERGDYLTAINGNALQTITQRDFIAALYPRQANTLNAFEVYKPHQGVTRQVALSSTEIVHQPVSHVSVITTANKQKVGYLVFNDHIYTATDPLVSAMKQFQAARIDDLVLDLRYNGGGYLYIASQLATMIGGQATTGQVFNRMIFNDKHTLSNRNFMFQTTDFHNQPLPMLNLKRVFVLTASGTCSASEAIINGLSPFIPVIQIGGETCGKPYGFNQTDNCAKAYFAIRFKGENSMSQSVPTQGFTPACYAGDDLNHDLGERQEAMLATALGYQAGGKCPADTAQMTKSRAAPLLRDVYRAPWRSIMTAP